MSATIQKNTSPNPSQAMQDIISTVLYPIIDRACNGSNGMIFSYQDPVAGDVKLQTGLHGKNHAIQDQFSTAINNEYKKQNVPADAHTQDIKLFSYQTYLLGQNLNGTIDALERISAMNVTSPSGLSSDSLMPPYNFTHITRNEIELKISKAVKGLQDNIGDGITYGNATIIASNVAANVLDIKSFFNNENSLIKNVYTKILGAVYSYVPADQSYYLCQKNGQVIGQATKPYNGSSFATGNTTTLAALKNLCSDVYDIKNYNDFILTSLDGSAADESIQSAATALKSHVTGNSTIPTLSFIEKQVSIQYLLPLIVPIIANATNFVNITASLNHTALVDFESEDTQSVLELIQTAFMNSLLIGEND